MASRSKKKKAKNIVHIPAMNSEMDDNTPGIGSLKVNRLHVMARIGRLVALGKDEKQVYNNLKDEVDLEGAGMPRNRVEREAAGAIAVFKNFRLPCERALWDLHNDEHELRADIIDKLQEGDMSKPGIVREIHKATSDIVDATGYASLVDGIETLEELGIDVTELRARLDKLGFPELEKDEDLPVTQTTDSTGLVTPVASEK